MNTPSQPNRPSKWTELVTADPEHSHRYAQRFRELADQGQDIYGEARLVDALLPRGSRVLDAGCGAGRTGGYLARAGHTVVGVDQDPVLIEAAQADYPEGTWLVGDLAELDLPARGIGAGFDAIVCAGNVMTFLHPETRVAVLRNFANHLKADGRAVVGFGRDRGYDFQSYLDDVAHAGLDVQVGVATWELRPFEPDSDFLVTVLGRAAG
ncbi:class I SAM-dependent methyltransferase [Enemella evansiae]|uniref:class I SAM-dependent methyltransferase n=1 Tax=Enemella evansiae TaxID=2016499 RepID=UPI001E4184C5|nr:class I SAM-dependent methyltransferase [Enemella evansiae]